MPASGSVEGRAVVLSWVENASRSVHHHRPAQHRASGLSRHPCQSYSRRKLAQTMTITSTAAASSLQKKIPANISAVQIRQHTLCNTDWLIARRRIRSTFQPPAYRPMTSSSRANLLYGRTLTNNPAEQQKVGIATMSSSAVRQFSIYNSPACHNTASFMMETTIIRYKQQFGISI